MEDKVKLIIDTDLGSDCDDAGALAVAYNLCKKGYGEIIGMTHCASEITGPIAIKAINEYFGMESIPIGRYDKATFLEEPRCTYYTKPIAKKYLDTHNMPEFEPAERALRRLLAKNKDVTIAVIGIQNNIANLLRTEPDDISSLNGVDLVKQSVKIMYVMGGHFGNLDCAEYNIRLDISSAQFVSENFPVPIVYCGFEIGDKVMTGMPLEGAAEDNPVRFAYYAMDLQDQNTGIIRHESWDPITVYCALKPSNDFFVKSAAHTIAFDEEGKVILNSGGKDYYMLANATNAEITAEINRYIL